MLELRKRLARAGLEQLEERLTGSIQRVLHTLLVEQGWSISRLSTVTGISRVTLTAWKKGQVIDPRYLAVARLFQLAGESLDLLDNAADEEQLSRSEVEKLVDDRVSAALDGSLKLILRETRGGHSLREAPAQLEQAVAEVKDIFVQQAGLRTRRKRSG